MAHTLDELFALEPPPAGTVDSVDLNLTVTQEDGRSAWGTMPLLVDTAARCVRPVGAPMAFGFSDRDQFRGGRDAINVTLTEREGGAVAVDVQLLTWNAAFGFIAQLVDDPALVGKLYYGWGETIGHGRGRALHMLSLTNLQRRPSA